MYWENIMQSLAGRTFLFSTWPTYFRPNGILRADKYTYSNRTIYLVEFLAGLLKKSLWGIKSWGLGCIWKPCEWYADPCTSCTSHVRIVRHIVGILNPDGIQSILVKLSHLISMVLYTSTLPSTSTCVVVFLMKTFIF